MTLARLLTLSPLLTLAFALGAGTALAEQADRQKPMNIEADALRFDDAQQTSQFTGNVVVTQGTLVIRAIRMDVRQDAQGEQFGTAYGSAAKRAFFRQKRDNVDEYIEGEADRLEYDSKVGEMRLIGNAEMRRYIGAKLSDVTDGQRIVYNTGTEVFTVNGSTNGGNGVRVRATLSPRGNGQASSDAPATTNAPASNASPAAAQAAGAPAQATPGSAAPLRNSTTLEGPRP